MLTIGIHIDQYALIVMRVIDRVNIVDMAVFTVIESYMRSPSKGDTIAHEGHTYINIRDKKALLAGLPICRISSVSSFDRSIANLISVGLIVKHPHNDTLRRCYLRLGDAGEAYNFLKDIPFDTKLKHLQEYCKTEKVWSAKAFKLFTGDQRCELLRLGVIHTCDIRSINKYLAKIDEVILTRNAEVILRRFDEVIHARNDEDTSADLARISTPEMTSKSTVIESGGHIIEDEKNIFNLSKIEFVASKKASAWIRATFREQGYSEESSVEATRQVLAWLGQQTFTSVREEPLLDRIRKWPRPAPKIWINDAELYNEMMVIPERRLNRMIRTDIEYRVTHGTMEIYTRDKAIDNALWACRESMLDTEYCRKHDIKIINIFLARNE